MLAFVLIFAQFVSATPTTVAPKVYMLTTAQTQSLKKASDGHKACMAQKSPQARNSCFHGTHHAFWAACEQIKSELKADPSATCDLNTLKVIQ